MLCLTFRWLNTHGECSSAKKKDGMDQLFRAFAWVRPGRLCERRFWEVEEKLYVYSFV